MLIATRKDAERGRPVRRLGDARGAAYGRKAGRDSRSARRSRTGCRRRARHDRDGASGRAPRRRRSAPSVTATCGWKRISISSRSSAPPQIDREPVVAAPNRFRRAASSTRTGALSGGLRLGQRRARPAEQAPPHRRPAARGASPARAASVTICSPDRNGRPSASTSSRGERPGLGRGRPAPRGATANSAPAMRAISDARALGVAMALDPPRDRLQHAIADRAAEGGVDRVVAGEADQQDDRAALLRPVERPRQPGERGAAVAQAGERVAPLVGRIGAQLLGPADDLAARRRPGHDARSGRHRRPGRHGQKRSPRRSPRPPDRAGGRSPPLRIELAHQIEHPDPAPSIGVEAGFPRQRRAQLDVARARLPAPGRAVLPARPGRRRARCADPLGMAAGELQRVQELRFRDRADQEMGGAEADGSDRAPRRRCARA